MRVMLVDDNYQILELLDEGISWQDEGMTLVAKCENGEEALTFAKENPIDILVTDIDMPKINGLELIDNLQQLYPNLQSIIISNHEEFKYAQKAIKLTVNDYILKDKLDPSSLLTTLNLVKNEAQWKKDDQSSLLESKTILKKNQFSIKGKWIRDIVNNPPKNKSMMVEQLLGYSLDISENQYISIAGKVINKEQAMKRFESSDLLMIAVEQLLNDFLSEKVEGFVYDQYKMIWFQRLQPEPFDVLEKISDFQKLLKEYFNIEFSIVYDSYCHNISSFLQSAANLQRMDHEWFFTSKQDIIDYKSINKEFIEQNNHELYDSIKNELKKSILKNDQILAEDSINNWFDQLVLRNLHPKIIKGISHKIIMDLYVNFHFVDNQEEIHAERIHFDISSAQSLEQLKSYYQHYITKIRLNVQNQRNSHRPEVWKALIYIDENIDRKITLKDISQKVYINPTYFSRIFKKETGQSFVDYVTKRKIEKAQLLLQASNDTIEVIAFKLGYNTSSYFIRQFKQYIGNTPLEYRNLLFEDF